MSGKGGGGLIQFQSRGGAENFRGFWDFGLQLGLFVLLHKVLVVALQLGSSDVSRSSCGRGGWVGGWGGLGGLGGEGGGGGWGGGGGALGLLYQKGILSAIIPTPTSGFGLAACGWRCHNEAVQGPQQQHTEKNKTC